MSGSAFKACLFAAGLGAIAFGFALIIRSGLGNDTIGVLAEGIALQTGLTIGNGSQLINAAAIVIVAVGNRKLIGAGTLISAFGIGMLLDLVLGRIGVPEGAAMQWLYLAAGIGIGGSGIALSIGSQFGASPVDSLMVLLSNRWNRSLRFVRIGLDLAMSAFGWMLGGNLGVGTIVTALCIGPVIQASLYLLRIITGDKASVN